MRGEEEKRQGSDGKSYKSEIISTISPSTNVEGEDIEKVNPFDDWFAERVICNDVATWFRVTAWGSLGEACNQHLSKGRQVLVEGELRADPETGAPRVWQRNDGTWGASFEVNARNVTFLGGRRDDDALYDEEPQQSELPF